MSTTAEAYRLLMAEVYELAGLSRRTSESVAARFGQTVARWHLLSVLSGGPHTVPGVARRLGLTRQSVQRVADELRDEGLIVSEPNPQHAGSPLLVLTRHGADVLGRIVAESDVHRTRTLARAGISVEELTSARAVLRALLAALDGQTDRHPQP